MAKCLHFACENIVRGKTEFCYTPRADGRVCGHCEGGADGCSHNALGYLAKMPRPVILCGQHYAVRMGRVGKNRELKNAAQVLAMKARVSLKDVKRKVKWNQKGQHAVEQREGAEAAWEEEDKITRFLMSRANASEEAEAEEGVVPVKRRHLSVAEDDDDDEFAPPGTPFVGAAAAAAASSSRQAAPYWPSNSGGASAMPQPYSPPTAMNIVRPEDVPIPESVVAGEESVDVSSTVPRLAPADAAQVLAQRRQE